MILIDTSAWIDYLRRQDTGARDYVRTALAADDLAVVMCEPIAMELLLGPREVAVVREVERLVNGLDSLKLDQDQDFRTAAEIYRDVRRSGYTPRTSVDCLIAAVGIRHDVAVAHKDADFEAIARVTGLKTVSLI